MKPGGTNKSAIGYELSDDFETPIQVKFYENHILGELADELVLNISGLN